MTAPTASARLGTAENVLSNPTSGLVTRTGALEVALTGPGGIQARLGTTEQVLGNASGGVVKRTSDLETMTGSLNGQINGGNGISSRLSTVEQSLASGANNEALAQRATTLEAQIAGNQGSNLLTRIQASETAYTDGRFASATALSQLNSTVDGMSSQVSTSYAAVTDGRFASTSSLNTLVSQVNGPGGLAASVSTTAQAVTDVKTGLAGARLRLAAVTPGGDASIEVASDTAGGGRLLFGGNAYFNGKLMIGKNLGGAHLEIEENRIAMYYSNGVAAIEFAVT